MAENFLSLYMGTPKTEQVEKDLRAAEIFKEAPRLAVPQSQAAAFTGRSWSENGAEFNLVDDRERSNLDAADVSDEPIVLTTFKGEGGQLVLMKFGKPCVL